MPTIDPHIHPPARLQLMTMLTGVSEAEFVTLRDAVAGFSHEGGFDVRTGQVLYGPPPRPLDLIVLEVRGAEVWAVGRKAVEHERSV